MIPKNQILVKYTSGNELVTLSTNTPYEGYYYEMNNKLYAGKEFEYNALELIKITQSNKLLNNSSTALFSFISNITSQQLSTPSITSLPNETNLPSQVSPTKFYCKKINNIPILIKEIDEKSYLDLQQTPIYQTTFIGTYKSKNQTLIEAEQQMPGISDFLNL